MDEIEALLKERLRKFEALIGQSDCRHIPHILLVFDDKITSANVGATPHFQHPLIRVLALLDVARHQCATVAGAEKLAQDEALLGLLRSVSGSTLPN